MVPNSVKKAVHAVLSAMGKKDRPNWSKFAKIESDPGSDLFMFEATDGVAAVTIMFSNPEYVDWGGVAWISEKDMRGAKEVETYLSEAVPTDYPESVRQHLATMMANATNNVDVHLSAYYWGVLARVLDALGSPSQPLQLSCASAIGPLQLTVVGGERDEWIEVNLFVMGLAREDYAGNAS